LYFIHDILNSSNRSSGILTLVNCIFAIIYIFLS